jgi:hypothetical protein
MGAEVDAAPRGVNGVKKKTLNDTFASLKATLASINGTVAPEGSNPSAQTKKPIVMKSPSIITQVDLAELHFRRREVSEIEEAMALALSKGTAVESGLHGAGLVLDRDDDPVSETRR